MAAADAQVPSDAKAVDATDKDSGSSILDPITPEQTELLQEFIKGIPEDVRTWITTHDTRNRMWDDETFLRFLRARKWKVDKALKMFLGCVRWRKENKVNIVLDKKPQKDFDLIEMVCPNRWHKQDKDGRPTLFLRVGEINQKEMNRRVQMPRFLWCHYWEMEHYMITARSNARAMGKPFPGLGNVFDLKGMGMSVRHILHWLQAMAQVDEKYYPETMGKLYVVNAPSIFPVIWGIVKPWLDPNTAAKVEVLGSNYKEILRQNFDPENLPEEYGGTCHCDGGCVPVHDLSHLAADDEKHVQQAMTRMQLEEVTVKAGKLYHVEHEVTVEDIKSAKEKGSVAVEVEFLFTSSKDIKFWVEWEPAVMPPATHVHDQDEHEGRHTDEVEEEEAAAATVHVASEEQEKEEKLNQISMMLDPSVYQSHQVPAYGELSTFEAGKLKFIWDNSNSYWSSKTVKFGVNRINRLANADNQ